MIRTIRGCITFLLVLLNAIWIILIVTPLGLLRLVPIKPFQILVLKLNEKLAELYLFLNSRIQDLMHGADYRVEGMEKLKKDICKNNKNLLKTQKKNKEKIKAKEK